MENNSLMRIEKQLCFPLYAAARKVVNFYTPLLKPLNLTYTQYITMMVLWAEKKATVGSLCKSLHLDSGTMTPLLKKLEDHGLVTRTRDSSDERVVHIALTEKGKALETEASFIPEKVSVCIDLSEQEAKTLYETLYKIINTI